MNSESIWDNPMIQENKNLVIFISSLIIFIGTIYWFLIKPGEQNIYQSPQTNIHQIIQNKPAKKRLTIHITYLTDIHNPDMSKLLPLFEKLNQVYDIFIIMLVEENENTTKLLDKYEALTGAKLTYKHVYRQ
jgi:hypothetical protein